MAVVNTNIGASVAQAALKTNERALNTAMEQLSTGKKINSAADNASGLAITNRMTSQIKGLEARFATPTMRSAWSTRQKVLLMRLLICCSACVSCCSIRNWNQQQPTALTRIRSS